ncbi:alpha-N-acetyl-neuraminyl-2,3-beta-galactosyl-1,3-N-acetyl-galactosaminide alpha-2,6-sialyltransferase isoform X2 [Latimeria chalumnae]|uniref:ST6 N-acetylgalactosaminide alpha-2,6-sialyltransferase 4 n=1 Tax=Latimeria chalumnae TaxID=7897 RepID=H3BAP3_LATCH|nr:PREDICTED: alpha-N-acetyl-neuraminyl-2,3-beta-galactosyl-1,3-N-acetyl-galactosaminide alpha-2,6-sialyltransferase isoform X3 [Latimeria chalumnae]|eukprot:XP_005993326.1 PREDICTED: alpha-N-acetyl-neuraminyl-2,3-beta-galactosyl-1,3-N-acetyl-galactosaminide alpha-2,6-sialyltransferase isoform X3 [Latimeria chalumnae]
MRKSRKVGLVVLLVALLVFLWTCSSLQLIDKLFRVISNAWIRLMSPVMAPNQPLTPWGYVRVSSGKLPLKLHCKECALVSSSGQMLGAQKGRDIDQTECVIRMNNAPTVTYEEDVGGRTTIRVVSHTSAPLLLRNQSYYFGQMKETFYVFWGPNNKIGREGQTFKALLKAAQVFPDAEIYILTPDKMDYCDSIFQKETGKNRMKSGAYLSTGWFTMILAMEVCDNIYVYGMVNDKYCRQSNHLPVPYHYYEKGRLEECKMYNAHENAPRAGHRFITEKSIFSRWAKQHNITFVYPQWDEME